MCSEVPPIKAWESEDFIAYSYRKWKWLCNHLVSRHARKEALVHRRIEAEERRLRDTDIERSKPRYGGRVLGIKRKESRP